MHRDVEQDRVVRVLLAERTNGLRRLVWSLVRDDGLTEDVLQDTFVTAVEKPPRDPEAARAWLTTVAKNFVRLRFREESRRSRREARVAKHVALESHELELDNRELREIVAECASAVPEPYRSTLIEIYYRGVSAKALARTLGVPESTVRVRKKRGLEFLRRELDRRVPGGRRQWIAGAIGWFGVDAVGFEDAVCAPGGSGAASLASTADFAASESEVSAPPANWAWRVPAFAAAVLLLAILWMTGVHDRDQETPPRPGSSTAQLLPTRSSSAEPSRGPLVSSVAAKESQSPDRSGATARLRVLDRDRQPVSAASVFTDGLEIPSERRSLGKSATEYLMMPFARHRIGETDEAGELELSAEVLAQQRLVVRSADHREYRERARLRVGTAGIDEYEVVLAPPVRSVVRVFDRERRPVAGVRVEFVGSSGDEEEAYSNADGVVVHDGVDRDYVVRVNASGYVPHVRLLRAPEHRITLADGQEAVGQVLAPSGEPVAEATVEVHVLGHTSLPIATRTDSAGRFRTPPLPTRGRVRVAIHHPEHATLDAAVSLPWTGAREFAFDSGAWVVGRIDRVEEFDHASIRVALIPLGEGGDRHFAAVNSFGDFRVGPVQPGRWVLSVETSSEFGFTPIELNELSEGVLDVGTLYSQEGIAVEGRVVTPAGDPVSGVTLRLGAVVGDDVHGPIVTTDLDGRFVARGLAPNPPEVFDRRDDDRWNALGRRDERRRGWIAAVVSPHQLLACNDEEIPTAALYGSRNTCGIDPRRTGWTFTVEDPSVRGVPRWALRTTDGRTIRTTTNLIVIPRDDPSARSVIFAGTDGVPAVHFDARDWRTSVVGVWTREYAVPFLRPPIDGVTVPTVLEERAPRTVRLERANGEPSAETAVFIEPILAQRSTGIAVWLGRTDATGRLDLSGIASGSYRLRTWSDSVPKRKLGPPIATIVAVEETVELGSISWEAEQTGEWTLRVSAAESGTAARLGSR
ncbi:MAG: sigma-70 family RNA polymerase sigma factor [Planctomycetota bacterium]